MGQMQRFLRREVRSLCPAGFVFKLAPEELAVLQKVKTVSGFAFCGGLQAD